MNNIIRLRGQAAASRIPVTRTQRHSRDCSASRMRVVQRPALVVVWHTNPFSGKLECLWTTEVRAVLDEDGSGISGRRAA